MCDCADVEQKVHWQSKCSALNDSVPVIGPCHMQSNTHAVIDTWRNRSSSAHCPQHICGLHLSSTHVFFCPFIVPGEPFLHKHMAFDSCSMRSTPIWWQTHWCLWWRTSEIFISRLRSLEPCMSNVPHEWVETRKSGKSELPQQAVVS